MTSSADLCKVRVAGHLLFCQEFVKPLPVRTQQARFAADLFEKPEQANLNEFE